MEKYIPGEFLNAIKNKIGNNLTTLKCPFCGGQSFTTTENVATVFISDDIKDVKLGPHIPSGMLICENCGHIELFALGSLGLLKGEKKDGR